MTQTRSSNLPKTIFSICSRFFPFRHGCSSRGDHRMPCPEGPQGPDEEGSRGCPDPAVGPSSVWRTGGILWESFSLIVSILLL